MFDHVVMGYATETRRAPMYPSQMPILEALVTLGYVAAVTERVTLSTEVLVLPQRQAVLVAKQVSTLDTLSGGRMRLGVGVGWQEAEYTALGQDYTRRGRQMDESIRLLRACWGDERIELQGEAFHADVIAMEPKPPQGAALPIWVGGSGPAALRRVGELGDGWMGMIAGSDDDVRAAIATIRRPRRRQPDVIPTPSGCRRCWRRRRTTAAARTSTPTSAASSPAPNRSATSASAGWRSTPPPSSSPAPAASTTWSIASPPCTRPCARRSTDAVIPERHRTHCDGRSATRHATSCGGVELAQRTDAELGCRA